MPHNRLFSGETNTMASSTSTSTNSAESGTPQTSQPLPPTHQSPWAPGVSNRALRHQRGTGFVYNEDYGESLFNGPADLPSQLELAHGVRVPLLDLEDRDNEDPAWRDMFWEAVARGDYLERWSGPARWESGKEQEQESETEVEDEDGDEDGGEGHQMARASGDGGGGGDEATEQEMQPEDEDGSSSDGEPNWVSLDAEMEDAELE